MLVFELEESLLIRNARIIRAPTIRPQHRYQVQRCRGGELLTVFARTFEGRTFGGANQVMAVVGREGSNVRHIEGRTFDVPIRF
jgi:hypothetical protein